MNILFLLYFLAVVSAWINPITIVGKSFVDSISGEPFYIKGVDYQPGGSSGFTDEFDPLSNPKVCARDIALFQKLGVNTIRVYSVNSHLDHDVCMSLLASAGIYLVLDVNSALPNFHLNRYEPWTTYNEEYLNNVFKVVEQFAGYNNTLAFFAGNEIVNDKLSATHSPVYVKAMIRDIKNYISNNLHRQIPVGYSAADDLAYSVSLSKYLECVDKDPAEAVDFYGVNSYQWCGKQTFRTSGYDSLVHDYSEYTRPVFLSEYGCNDVQPRDFDEVASIYSDVMNAAFSGGLVYEFTEEPNNYGLVKVLPNKDIQLLRDFTQFQSKLASLPDLSKTQDTERKKMQSRPSPRCAEKYSNIDVSRGLPISLAGNLIQKRVNIKRGKLVEVRSVDAVSPYRVMDVQGGIYLERPQVELRKPINANWTSGKTQSPPATNGGDGLTMSWSATLLSMLVVCVTIA